MKRKLLFLVFTDDACRQNHAFMYALECAGKGHKVSILLEGPATACVNRLKDGGKFGELFRRANRAGLIAGACKTASGGCSTGKKERQAAAALEKEGVGLISDLGGHAGIERFIAAGCQAIVF
ncbi:MAG: hypothetical protein A3J79_06590 [Elusimicrobia bacterium RIFOXYB2_FULL_62_6]|nr:MAG: hypothetical protein A3J79_06590 [Elusimicrobia bacterium RIFOXYB2_FULL_62_6]